MAPTRRPPLPWKQHYETKERTPPCTGWLLKRKQTERKGVGRILNGGANRRFFTLDFDGGSFYYGHSSTKTKQVSKPIGVGSIARVEPIAFTDPSDDNNDEEGALEMATEQSTSDNISVTSKTSSSSLASRIFRFSGRKADEEVNGFTLHFRGASEQRMELMCESRSDTDRWVAAFEAAMKSSLPDGVRCSGLPSEEVCSEGGSTAATPRDACAQAASESD